MVRRTIFYQELSMKILLMLSLLLGSVALSTGCKADVDDDGASLKVGD